MARGRRIVGGVLLAQALTTQQVNDLVAYMLTLKRGQDNEATRAAL